MLEKMADWVWGPGLLVLLLGTGLYLSVRSHFWQLTGWKAILFRTFGQLGRVKAEDTVSAGQRLNQFQTFAAALAAAMGTGNIIGVAAAIAVGGPGAIFWMWISAVLGMMLTYTENVLGMRYAQKLPNGREVRGPMAYLRFGLHSPMLAAIYAVLCVAASFGIGNLTQTSAIATLAEQAFAIPQWGTAIVTAVLLGCIVLGGTRRLGRVVQWLMPVLSGVYMLAALWIILKNVSSLPAVWNRIFFGAFGMDAVGGGISGALLREAVRTGLRHGIFSNEAGLGSSALVHAGGASDDGRLQGMWSMVEVALDTLVCCTLTAFAILCSGISLENTPGTIVVEAFSGLFGHLSSSVMAVMIALFAFCTLIGWCCCGEQAVHYLSGERGIFWYRIMFCFAAGIGGGIALEPVWALSDIANGCMAVPNLLGLLLLSGRAADIPNNKRLRIKRMNGKQAS